MVLVADNGSTDGSQEIAERAGARVVPVPERGYGAALLGGIAEELRLPLVPVTAKSRELIADTLKQVGLLK